MTKLLNNHREITHWLESMNIENYLLIPHKTHGFVVDVRGMVDLSGKNLHSIQVQFHRVEGDFNCDSNLLKNLTGAPHYVAGNFRCSDNTLTSLEGSPRAIHQTFRCNDNQLTSLLGGPDSVGVDYLCWGNKLTSLRGSPHQVGRDFNCEENMLISLEHGPQIVQGIYCCNNNRVQSLEFCPEYVKKEFLCHNNPSLGDLQTNEDFEVVYRAHTEILDIKNEKNLLSRAVENPPKTWSSPDSPSKYKI